MLHINISAYVGTSFLFHRDKITPSTSIRITHHKERSEMHFWNRCSTPANRAVNVSLCSNVIAEVQSIPLAARPNLQLKFTFCLCAFQRAPTTAANCLLPDTFLFLSSLPFPYPLYWHTTQSTLFWNKSRANLCLNKTHDFASLRKRVVKAAGKKALQMDSLPWDGTSDFLHSHNAVQ